MNEETFIRVTHQPCQAPMSRPTQRQTRTATIGSTLNFTVSSATTTPISATAEPTERSKFRVTISMTALMAANPTMAVCSASRIRLRCVRKVPLVAK